ncbi:YgaP-like transmembrane domain [Polaromonas sp. CT11-55]|uniref:YgaP-like transmembrane domain n=1 Tax=Polaromonas sp. CT11-55 TaxID=3243045 RepID=UPI0039A63CA8
MFFLQRNLPAWERALRLGGALLLACAGLLWLPAGWPMALALAGAAGLGLTGVAGFCPACALVGRKPAAKGKP